MNMDWRQRYIPLFFAIPPNGIFVKELRNNNKKLALESQFFNHYMLSKTTGFLKSV